MRHLRLARPQCEDPRGHRATGHTESDAGSRPEPKQSGQTARTELRVPLLPPLRTPPSRLLLVPRPPLAASRLSPAPRHLARAPLPRSRTWAKSVMPTVATSPSSLTYSCDLAYLRPSTTAGGRGNETREEAGRGGGVQSRGAALGTRAAGTAEGQAGHEGSRRAGRCAGSGLRRAQTRRGSSRGRPGAKRDDRARAPVENSRASAEAAGATDERIDARRP